MQKIRLWRLGNLRRQSIPTPEDIQAFEAKLAAALTEQAAEEFVDLVWGPDISCEVIPESTDDVITPFFPGKEG